jgi:hypothetical protein
MRRAALMCIGAALMLGLFGGEIDRRPPPSSVKSGHVVWKALPPGQAKRRTGNSQKALPPGLLKQGSGKRLPPGVAKSKANHGQCVSRWAHEATDQGLSGPAHARFVSSIAQDLAAVGGDCDKHAALDAALRGAAD